jgi:hypothetical protein
MVRRDPAATTVPSPQIFALRTPTPAPAPAPSANEPEDTARYSLVLSPTSNTREAAERLRHYVGRRGHEAVVEVIGRAPREQFKVRIVGLRTRATAQRIRAALEREHLQPTIVPPG